MAIDNETEVPTSGDADVEETAPTGVDPTPDLTPFEEIVEDLPEVVAETETAEVIEAEVAETEPAPVTETEVVETIETVETAAEAAPVTAEEPVAETDPIEIAEVVDEIPAEVPIETDPLDGTETPVASAADDIESELVASGTDDIESELVASGADDFESELVASGADDIESELVASGADDFESEPVVTAPAPDAGMRPAITAPRDIGDIADDLSAADFAEAVERTVFEFKEGDIVAGIVVRVDPDEALIDIGYKSEGVVPANELSIRNSANPADVVKVGDEIEALVMQKEDESGRLVLSKKRAQYERAWGRIEGVMAEGGTVTGPVIEVVKGGLIVDIGLRGFLPASLVDLRRVRDLHPFVGESIEAKVIELDKNRNNVVLSRRAYLEEAQAEQRHAFLEDLQPGDVREGVVSSVVNFGAFVDLGGMDGLVHVSELSWQHVSHPSEVVTVGDKVDIKVLEVDRDRERISLSIRQTAADPWDTFAGETEVGAIIDGVVTKTVPFGAFVSVGAGVEGLVHVSEIAIHHVDSPELELSIGQQVRVKVTEVDIDRRRVSLSIKQALPEWEERSQFASEPRAGAPRREQAPPRPRKREFQREEEVAETPTFSADSSLEAILAELKERGIGRK